MKRNTVTVIKYLIFAAFFLTLGPVLLKFLFGDINLHSSKYRSHKAVPKGDKPVDPEELNKIFMPREWEIKNKHSSQEKVNLVLNLRTPTSKDDNKIDWFNYLILEEDAKREGPGEQGAGHFLSSKEDKEKEKLYSVNGFNALVSDRMSLDRSVKDIRHPHCKGKKYIPKLLNASIVIPFHNEHWSTLLRSVKSVINRSPKILLHEIVLVDDFSSKEHCKKKLDHYVAEHFGKLVKIVRQSKREGLIRTRIAGAKVATGDVIIFLDSHIEANYNWLPPLLEPITKNYKVVVCPFIDVIDHETFEYRAQDEGSRGAFDWEFFYKRLPLLRKDLENPSRPFKSPVMAGGLFAISTKWFWELGGYDPGLDIWGGEQYELSFKIWQCGGIMVDAPCSRVGHVYRKFAPFPNPGIGDFIARNYKRVAEVWMDEYKEYIYLRRPHYKSVNAGNMSEQFDVRERLHCKPFKWFMEKVAFDLPRKYPMVEPPDVGSGKLTNVASNKCLEMKSANGVSTLLLGDCGKGNQFFQLTWHRDIRTNQNSKCLDVSQSNIKAPVIIYPCHGMQGNQWFKYNVETKQLLHPTSNQCLDCDSTNNVIFMMPCSNYSLFQKWEWEKVNIEQAKIDWLASRFDSSPGEDEGAEIDIGDI